MLLLIFIWAAYFPAVRGQFIWDDNLLVVGNKLVHAPDGLYRLWFTTEPSDYWPLTNSTFWIEWRLWGENPAGYHVANLLLHFVSALLLWKILSKLSIPGACFAAILFAVHPANVESVAWIAQRKNTLAMVFFLLSILCYVREFDGPRDSNGGPPKNRWYWLSLLAFVLAMLGKGSVASLPLVLLLIVWWRRGRIAQRDLGRTVPFFLVAGALTGVNIWFQTHGGEAIRTATIPERLIGAGAIAWFYLSKALVPIDLSFVYPQWQIDLSNWLWWLPALAALAVTVALGRLAHRRQSDWARALLFSWLFFCVALLPVLGLTDVYFMKFALVADHYQYIAIIAVVALIAAGCSVWYRRATSAGRLGAIAATGALALSFTWASHQQSRLYADPITLYEATLKSNPNCWLARVNLGQEFLAAGRRADAIRQFEQAVQIKPDLAEAYNNLGACRSTPVPCPRPLCSLKRQCG